MIRKLALLLPVVFLFSCQSGAQKTDATIVQKTPEVQENYQTIESEDQLAAINKQAEQEVQEIEVQDRIFFKYDSNELSNEAKKVLDVQTMWLKNDTSVSVILEGHCDERGTREYNIALGERRANMVKNYLVSQGIDASRLKTTSYGKERPAFSGNNEEIFAKNRRVVTVIANS